MMFGPELRRQREGSHAPAAFTLVVAVALVLAGCASAVATPTPTPPPTLDPTASPSPTASPTPFPTFTPWPTVTPSPTPSPTPVSAVWTLNVYNGGGMRLQNPDNTACTAASAMAMLNFAAAWGDYKPLASGQAAPSKPHAWKVNTYYTRMEVLLTFERKYGTMDLSWGGADAHGWRNALNYYGWGNIKAGIYKDLTYKSFDDAARATVMAVALYRKPVGILASAGNHAQIVTGYRVKGQDPRTGSTDFVIEGVYVSDPLKQHNYFNAYIPLATWSGGVSKIRFTPYLMTNSPYVDSVDHKNGNAEWDGKWVIVAPVA